MGEGKKEGKGKREEWALLHGRWMKILQKSILRKRRKVKKVSKKNTQGKEG
jgi:hypothetical protein